ncbi:MAG: creatininase family protein [Verrucomicrobiales bacterium]|nr:creatininase family protein [Verrucomicrobiae bacterium]MCP5554656.1 creatininase family protein [Akkermansiaceae bacterium]HRX54356.1 creatininase family protein [Verrucomicrobiales bacterium]
MRLADLTWPDIDSLNRDLPVLIPVAALEQHGRHMPVFTDSLLMGEVARRAEKVLGRHALFAPLQWLGNSHHHLDFPGTLSAEPRLYLDLLCGLVENFLHHGFRRVLIINGHGGNDVPGKQAIFELRQRHRDRMDLLLLFATYWHLAPGGHAAHPDLQQPEMGHAGEWETSMVLRLAPELVRDHRQAPDVPFGQGFEPASRGWTMRDRSEPGHIGRPALATPEKGEALFEHFTSGLVRLVERMEAWDGVTWDG